MANSHPCFFPLNGLTIDPQGNYGYCLASSCRASSQEELSDLRLQHHQELTAGKWPANCSSCKNKEQNNIQSRREKFLISRQKIYGDNKLSELLTDVENFNLQHVEISFSNICNLTCAMCSGEFSSSWMTLEKNHSDVFDLNLDTKPHKLNRLSQFQIDELVKSCSQAKTVIIKGGEPTMDLHLNNFLKEIQNQSKLNPSIFIQSNGTQNPNTWLDGINELKLELGVSIDGFGDTYKWIRGENFELILQNLRIAQEHPAIHSISIDFTLSIYNVLALDDFLQKILLLKNEFPKISTCPFFQWAQDSYNHVELLSEDLRFSIFEKIKSKLDAHSDFFVNSIVLKTLLQSPPSRKVDKRAALRRISFLDEKRSLPLFHIWPELKNELLESI